MWYSNARPRCPSRALAMASLVPHNRVGPFSVWGCATSIAHSSVSCKHCSDGVRMSNLVGVLEAWNGIKSWHCQRRPPIPRGRREVPPGWLVPPFPAAGLSISYLLVLSEPPSDFSTKSVAQASQIGLKSSLHLEFSGDRRVGMRINRCALRGRSCDWYPMRYIWNGEFPFAEDNLRCSSHCDKLEQCVKIEL